MEVASFGTALQRCRLRQISSVYDARNILLLGDGDGRFTEALLRENRECRAVALDRSAGMLGALRQRCARDAGERLTAMHCNLSVGLPESVRLQRFDAVVTHFFLDCLTTEQVERLARDVCACTATGAVWIVSEFAIPERGMMRLPAKALIRWLYLCFGALTGLHVQQLPRYAEAMAAAGWLRERRDSSLCGLLASEVWRRAS